MHNHGKKGTWAQAWVYCSPLWIIYNIESNLAQKSQNKRDSNVSLGPLFPTTKLLLMSKVDWRMSHMKKKMDPSSNLGLKFEFKIGFDFRPKLELEFGSIIPPAELLSSLRLVWHKHHSKNKIKWSSSSSSNSWVHHVPPSSSYSWRWE
jgi:hypothetical protein